MTKTARQSLVLAILLVILAAVIVQQMRTPAPAGGAATSSNPAVADIAASDVSGAVTDVQLGRLSPEPVAFAAPRRDPFRFRPQAPPPEVMRPAVSQPLPPPGPPAPPPREAISSRIRLLGIYETGSRRIAVLHDGTPSPPMHGVEGDVIQGQFRLVRVLPNAVELTYLDGGSPQSIPLPGQ